MKELFKELEDEGDVIDNGVGKPELFFVIRKDKFDLIKQKHLELDWVGYDEIGPENRPINSRKGYPYRKGR